MRPMVVAGKASNLLSGAALQGLVYVFIALAALGIAGAAYFGLTFTPIEAAVTAIAFGCIAILLVERQLRRNLPQNRPELSAQQQQAGREKISQCLLAIAQFQHVSDVATSLNRKSKIIRCSH